MTSKKLIDKMLAHGFEKCGTNDYGKNINDVTVIVSISENDSATTGEWFMPHFKEITKIGMEYFHSWSASGINQALSKRKYF